MIRQTALLLFAVVCVAPYFAFATEDDAALFDTPLFAVSEESTAQPQRSLMATTTTTSGSYPGSYPGGYYGGSPPPTTTCKSGKDYEVYFIATDGVIKSKATGKFRYGVYRDKVLIPQLKAVAKARGLPWKFPVTNFSRCVVKKARAFTKKNFHCRVVCNLTDVPCKRRPGVRNALRNAAKAPKGKVSLIVANNA